MEKNPQFQMEISNVRIDEYAAYCVVSFDKKIWLDPNKTPKTYPSYLHVEIIDGTWKIVTEGDLITDENLGKKDNNLKLLKVVNVDFNNSLAPQSGNTYYPSNLCDGNIATAWAINLDEAIYDDDKLFGPVFNVRCKKLSHIIIRNGYCKNDDSFRNNTRAAKIVFYNPDCYDRCILFDGSLRDTSAPQKLEISSNIEGEGNSNIKRIGMDFYTQNNGGFYKGAKWNDLCISEVEFWGYE